MVFESLIGPLKAEKSPWEMFFFGFLFASIGVLLSLWIFKEYAGLISVFFTVMACTPLVFSAIQLEEEKIDYSSSERSLIKDHSKALIFFIFLFIGMTLAFATWYVFMPQDLAKSVFSIQSNTINQINGAVTSNFNIFTSIFFNNLRVLTFCILFSFFFGFGAIFILTWNASVIAVAMGSLIKNQIFVSTSGIILAGVQGYSTSILRYFVHGIPEILAYFVAALAGGIISVAIVKKDILTKNFQKIAFDASILILISLFILLLAAFLEVAVTPNITSLLH